MDRRSSIQTLLIGSLATLVLPSCSWFSRDPAVILKNITLEIREEDIIAALCDTLIPETKKQETVIPGALGTQALEFSLTMVDDCYEPKKQQKFVKGLKEFDLLCEQKLGNAFHKLEANEKLTFLRTIATGDNIPSDITFFFQNLRQLTIRSYTQSEFYLTKVQEYKLVPGVFYGCVKVVS
ncbi:gluconate 2-dehydrogenase subunit 3 family protein [Pedobacter glucosidilyticus]|uniref:gluconate 2-dehydrogenase subunit 3 family protein n=1 Tax=Pedobacter glucosidilyticus TaxID=1122941 RepID=UPI0026EFA13F|nr:gluconate 2-dehydrogenase subunit 3 family protein [Pedobacter glucosidilyticus]